MKGRWGGGKGRSTQKHKSTLNKAAEKQKEGGGGEGADTQSWTACGKKVHSET